MKKLLLLLCACSAPSLRLQTPPEIRQGQLGGKFNALSGRIDVYFNSNCAKPAVAGVDLQIDGAEVKAHVDVDQPGQYSAVLTFYETRPSGKKIVLQQTCLEVAVEAGKQTPAPIDTTGEDLGFDADADGKSNLAELLAGEDCEKSALSYAADLGRGTETVVLGTQSGNVFVTSFTDLGSGQVLGLYSADTGAKVWSRTDLMKAKVDVEHNRVIGYLPGAQCQLTSLDLTTGTVQWQKPMPEPCSAGGLQITGPVLVRPTGEVFAPTHSSGFAFVRVLADGSAATTLPVSGGQTVEIIDADSASRGDLYVGTYEAMDFNCLNSHCTKLVVADVSGAPVVTAQIPISQMSLTAGYVVRVAVGPEGNIYVLLTGTLTAYNKTGATLWSKVVPAGSSVPGAGPGDQPAGLHTSVPGPLVLASGDVLVRTSATTVIYAPDGSERKQVAVGAGADGTKPTRQMTVLPNGHLLGVGTAAGVNGVFTWDDSGAATFVYAGAQALSDVAVVGNRLFFAGTPNTARMEPELPREPGPPPPPTTVVSDSFTMPPISLIAVDLP